MQHVYDAVPAVGAGDHCRVADVPGVAPLQVRRAGLGRQAKPARIPQEVVGVFHRRHVHGAHGRCAPVKRTSVVYSGGIKQSLLY